MKLDIVILALTKRLFRGESYHKTSCPSTVWARTIARIGPRTKDQLPPWRAVKTVKPKGFAKHFVACLEQACSRPTDHAPAAELSHTHKQTHFDGKLRRHLQSPQRGCAERTSQHAELLRRQQFVPLFNSFAGDERFNDVLLV